MRIAFTHNLRLSDSEDEAEFDSAETVDAIAAGLRAGGHEVEKLEVTGPASRLAERIESFTPDLIFNTAEGRRGRARGVSIPRCASTSLVSHLSSVTVSTYASDPV